MAPRRLIVQTPDVLFGAPRIAGTRVSVALVRERIAAGDTVPDVCSAYGLTPDQITAALAYAARMETDRGDIDRIDDRIDAG